MVDMIRCLRLKNRPVRVVFDDYRDDVRGIMVAATRDTYTVRTFAPDTYIVSGIQRIPRGEVYSVAAGERGAYGS